MTVSSVQSLQWAFLLNETFQWAHATKISIWLLCLLPPLLISLLRAELASSVPRLGRYSLETLIPEARVVCPSCSTTHCFSHQNAAISFCPCVTFFSLHSHTGTHMNLHCLRTCFTCNFSFWKCSVRRSETSQWELSTVHLPLPTSVCSCQEYDHLLKEIITSKCLHWDKLYWFHAMI